MTTTLMELGSHSASGEKFKDRVSYLDVLAKGATSSTIVIVPAESDSDRMSPGHPHFQDWEAHVESQPTLFD